MGKICEIIEKVLDDIDLVYTKKNMDINEISHIFYVINLSFNNKFLDGGLVYNETENELTFLFFENRKNKEENDIQLYKKVNELNEFLKYGRVYLDKESLVYELNIYIFANKDSEKIFLTYISTVIATAKSVFGEKI
mgnify:CR=1 FL=1